MLNKAVVAEAFGTFWLVLGGCGSAVLSAAYPSLGIGFAGVAAAFGLALLTMGYAVGPISGGHFNPAVTIGLWVGGRFPASRIVPYAAAQVGGAVAAALVVALIASGRAGWTGGLASNGYGLQSPGGYGLVAGLVVESVLTAIFLVVILAATRADAPIGFAPVAIGLCLTLIHLISIPVTNTSVNPARSTGPALIEALAGHGLALRQLWAFWVAPIVGAVAGGAIWRWLAAPTAS